MIWIRKKWYIKTYLENRLKLINVGRNEKEGSVVKLNWNLKINWLNKYI